MTCTTHILENLSPLQLKHYFDTFEGAPHQAAREGLVDVIRQAYALGISFNRENEIGDTPLFTATAHDRREVVELLLEMYPNEINYESSNGFTPLMIAVRDGHTYMTELLLKKGADPHSLSRDVESFQPRRDVLPIRSIIPVSVQSAPGTSSQDQLMERTNSPSGTCGMTTP